VLSRKCPERTVADDFHFVSLSQIEILRKSYLQP
jgi:hypothetical protein